MARLGDICSLNMGQSPDSESYNENGEGLPFFQGNADFGVLHPSVRVWCNAPTKIAHTDDILISVRAPIGALNIANIDCCIGRGLAALTVNQSICDRKYLWHAISSKIDELNSKGTGSTFKAINKNVLADTEIPLPPLDTQRRIAAVLDKVSDLIVLRKQQLAKLDELVKARFVEMFGDPVANEKELPQKALASLGSLERGKSQHRPRNAPELLNGPYPLIQTGEVASAGLYIAEFHSTYSELGLKQSKMWKSGTLCITIAANIAQTAILTFDACFPDSVVGFAPYGEVDSIYIHYWFSFFQKILEEQAPQVAQKNINLAILSGLKVIVPNRESVDQFATFVEQVNQSKAGIQQGLDKLETLKSALMQEYFG